MNRAPLSVLIISIIGIILSALGLLSGLWSVAALFLNTNSPLAHDSTYILVIIISGVIGLLTGLLLLAASIASLRLIPWGRPLMLLYAALHILISLTYAPINLLIVGPRVLRTMPPTPGLNPALLQGIFIGISIVTVLLALIWASCILYFFTRPKTINAFKGLFPANTTNFPLEPLTP